MKLRSALLAATVLAMPFAASAQPVTGLYIGGGAGVNLLQDESVSANIGGGSLGKLKSEVGFAGVLSIGWGFGNGLRAELEGDYRNNHFSNFSGSGGGTSFAGGGREQKYGPMVNVLYDFSVAPWLMPYVGVGVGWQAANWQNVHAYGGTPLTNVTFSNSSPGSFAYQAILGAAFPLPFVPGLAFTTEYRFMGLAGKRGYSGTVTTGSGAAVPVGVNSTNDYNHAFLLGFRYNFGVAPPPAPAAAVVPAQAPARSYLVFFDWDKANLTDRARQIIADAAANSTKVQYTRIEVNGYTDTSGTPQCTRVCRCVVPRRCRPNWSRTACHRTRSRSRASAKRICWFLRDLACASRRTGASRLSSTNRRRVVADDTGLGRREAPLFVCAREGSEPCVFVMY